MNILQYLKGTKKKINLYIIIKIINLSDTQIQILLTMKRREDLQVGYIFLLGKSPISWNSQLQEKRNFIYC